jgi:hypothetical protein
MSDDLVYRLREQAEIRRQIPDRKLQDRRAVLSVY